ncbi:methyl-accepting chemotaxis protein [Paraburkholderia ferrariae]|uniref:methyl-accepting chemotaxis protein n=1 Tax=Paraburkholderia ferrariae TaxID=386056 RepID=UPI000486A85D|nr:methyl-accepting chemotaxis protein [Paraburkholderia ferrariae]
MLKAFSIKSGLTCVIAVFVVILGILSAVGGVALKQNNDDLRSMYEVDTRSLVALKTSDALLQRARVSLDSYLSLYGLGDPEPTLLSGARQDLKDSETEFSQYLSLQKSTDSEAIRQLAASRRLVLDKSVLPAADALGHMDFGGFKELQGKATQDAVASYQRAMKDRENAVVDSQRERYAQAQSRFHLTIAALVGTAIIALAVGVIARLALVGIVVRPVAEIKSHLARIASGNLQGDVLVEYRNEMGTLLADVRTMQDALVRTVRSVRSGTETINLGAQEIASGNTDLSRRTEQQAASLELAAANMAQLTRAVKSNAETADAVSRQALTASQTASAGGEVVHEVVRTMQGISEHSGKIVEIVVLIESIAFQTNILALNAAVEAARAGELGRGFAVVAGEVRSLAQRSAQAAKEIKHLIDATVGKIAEGSQLAESAGAIMTDVVSSVTTVSGLMCDVQRATQEQSRDIGQVSDAVLLMDKATQQNAALVEEAAAAAESLKQQAALLDEVVSEFKIAAPVER